MSPLVYVVDDERIVATTLAAILQNNDFEAEPFFNPLEALSAAENRVPDILLSDVVMPQMDGIDLAIQFKDKYSACRILLFSGQATTSDLLQKALLEGHTFQVLTKPVHPTDLLAALKAL